ncbi:MAG: 3-deoxy-D-manno-octulosonic acid transferase [Planctomycetes bacterium]|nr:3-deoxy-D-manno-octulosonic acid transferase [Planctomycetota bacterium]
MGGPEASGGTGERRPPGPVGSAAGAGHPAVRAAPRPPGAALDARPIHADPNPGPLRWLLHGFYDLVWLSAAGLASPWWLFRAAREPAFRQMTRERLALGLRLCAATAPIPGPGSTQVLGSGSTPGLAPDSLPRRRVLVHGVSVGEIKGAAPLVRRILEQFPDAEVVLSSTTSTGLAVARQVFPEHAVVRFPLDISFVARRFLRSIDPMCVVLMELEIWPNFLRECNRAGVPVAVVNGRITQKSFRRYRWFRRSLPQFNRISLFCVQSEDYAARFSALSRRPERVLVTGSMKADGLVIGARTVPPALAALLGGRRGEKVIVAGSTHEPEELLVTQAWLSGAREARLVLVPRHPQRAREVQEALGKAGTGAQLLSDLRRGVPPDPRLPAIVDTIGELENVYALADLVFVGGSLLPHGGQNMLEPAAQGKAVVYGPHVANFVSEAALLEAEGASRRVADPAELERVFRDLSQDDGARRRMGAAGLSAVERQKGATALTLEALARLIVR